MLIRRSTLCGWIAAAADLFRPLYDRMCELVLESKVIHTDDTPVKLLASGKCLTARFWTYIGDQQHPYSVYDFTASRERDGPAKFLKGFEGYLQADAYGGYDGIYSGSDGRIIEVACWTHCRRYWYESRSTDSRRAHQALGMIARLYQLERQFADANLRGDGLRDARQEHSKPILDEFHGWLNSERDAVLPKSVIGAAFRYTANQWIALGRYVEDGALSIDNNVSERTVKIPAIGRKNWLFVASQSGGDRAAILFSLVASCKANQVEPFAYLRHLFQSLPTRNKISSLDDLLPDQWLQSHPHHRWTIDAVRKKERLQKSHL
jgi:hypothetical protein